MKNLTTLKPEVMDKTYTTKAAASQLSQHDPANSVQAMLEPVWDSLVFMPIFE